jgi:hypothetical protein
VAEDLHAIADLIGDAYDLAPIEVSNLLVTSPFLNLLQMVPSSNGTTHKYVRETGAPIVGFRAVNVGREQDSSDDTAVSVDLKVLDFSFTVDVAVARAWRKNGEREYLAREAKRHMAAGLMAFERQIFNGQIGASDSAGASGASGGFTGFRDAATVDALADTMVVTAGAGTADVNSSVWAVRLAEDGVCGVFKGDGDPFEMLETSIIQRNSSAALYYPAYYTAHSAWLGLQVGSSYDIGRIANVTATTGLTDDMIADLLSRFPIGKYPTHILMSRRSRKFLQDSRTATTTNGAPAPFPTEAFGVPIIATDAITDTEELIA